MVQCHSTKTRTSASTTQRIPNVIGMLAGDATKSGNMTSIPANGTMHLTTVSSSCILLA